MSCCGRARAEVQPAPLRREVRPAEAQLRAPMLTFEYTGATRLLVDGPVTRQRYRFDQPGARLDVDARDAPSFAAVPNLRRVVA